jgi:predicted phosphodiesterase
MRVWVSSDIHLDYKENLNWFMQLSAVDYIHDCLILAGDISDDIELISDFFRKIRPKFKLICFVCGNHDLWVYQKRFSDSFQKFDFLLKICKDEGIHTGPLIQDDLQIVPLNSWYDFSFGKPNKVILKAWKDFKYCRWPFDLSAVRDHFHQLNAAHLQRTAKTVISFSHFVPSIEILPDLLPKLVQSFFPVFGSISLLEQINTLNSDMHIYGHSHLNRSVKFQNTHYINNAYGYPSEAHICRKKLLCVYEDNTLKLKIPQWPKRPKKIS